MKQPPIKQTITNVDSLSINIYLRDISKYPILSEAEEKEIAKKITQGDKKAQETLINSNLRFVVSIAKQYQYTKTPLPDLIESGNIGLIIASNSFNPNLGIRFISYAVWWIRKIIIKECNLENHIITIPEVNLTLLNKIKKASDEFEQKMEREPSSEELAEILNENVSWIDSVKNKIPFKVELNEIPENEKIDFIKESATNSISIELQQEIKKVLDPREYQIISNLMGFNGVSMDLQTIAENLNITKVRAQQLKNKAIIKLRYSDKVLKLLKNEF